MSVKLGAAEVVGLLGEIIDVEIDLARGLFHFAIVGLADKAVEEAKERVSAAILFGSAAKGLARFLISPSRSPICSPPDRRNLTQRRKFFWGSWPWTELCAKSKELWLSRLPPEKAVFMK